MPVRRLLQRSVRREAGVWDRKVTERVRQVNRLRMRWAGGFEVD